MNTKLNSAFISPLFLKAASLIIGFLFWSILSDSFISSRWVTVPIAFYNKGDEKITSPEHIQVELRGKRSFLKNLDSSVLTLHLDAQILKPGPNSIEVTPDQLFLPSTLFVGETIPHNVIVHIERTAHAKEALAAEIGTSMDDQPGGDRTTHKSDRQ